MASKEAVLQLSRELRTQIAGEPAELAATHFFGEAAAIAKRCVTAPAIPRMKVDRALDKIRQQVRSGV